MGWELLTLPGVKAIFHSKLVRLKVLTAFDSPAHLVSFNSKLARLKVDLLDPTPSALLSFNSKLVRLKGLAIGVEKGRW